MRICALWLLAMPLFAGPAQDLVAEANALSRAGKHTEAILLYRKALALRPNSPEALYDLGIALYRKGEIAPALESFERAARLGRKGRVAALGNYNAGNSAFQQGLTLAATDPRGALSMMERSIDSYREALRIDPKMQDAAHNLEVVRKWLRLLEKQFAQANMGPGDGPPMSGPGIGVSVDAIFKQDGRNRSSGGAKAPPPAVDKDW